MQKRSKKKAPKKKGNKFGAKKTTYNGEVYDSAKEAAYAKKLDILRRASGDDKVLKIDRQVKYDLEVNGHLICKYVLDFKVTYPNRVEHIDVKGLKKGAAYQNFRLKKKLMAAVHGVEVIEV